MPTFIIKVVFLHYEGLEGYHLFYFGTHDVGNKLIGSMVSIVAQCVIHKPNNKSHKVSKLLGYFRSPLAYESMIYHDDDCTCLIIQTRSEYSSFADVEKARIVEIDCPFGLSCLVYRRWHRMAPGPTSSQLPTNLFRFQFKIHPLGQQLVCDFSRVGIFEGENRITTLHSNYDSVYFISTWCCHTAHAQKHATSDSQALPCVNFTGPTRGA